MKRVLRVLEYEKMKQQLLGHVASSLGRRKVNELQLQSISMKYSVHSLKHRRA